MSKLVARAREWAAELEARARADEKLKTPTRHIRLDNMEAGMLSVHLIMIAEECERLEKELGTLEVPRGSSSGI